MSCGHLLDLQKESLFVFCMKQTVNSELHTKEGVLAWIFSVCTGSPKILVVAPKGKSLTDKSQLLIWRPLRFTHPHVGQHSKVWYSAEYRSEIKMWFIHNQRIPFYTNTTDTQQCVPLSYLHFLTDGGMHRHRGFAYAELCIYRYSLHHWDTSFGWTLSSDNKGAEIKWI